MSDPYDPHQRPTVQMAAVRVPDAPPRDPASYDRPTLASCPWCDGCGLVTFAKLATWQADYPELRREDDEEIVP